MRRAGSSDNGSRQTALEELLAIYTPALKAFLLASRLGPADRVDDLVHDFVTDKILARKLLHHADRAKGKFQNLLLKSLSNFAKTSLKRQGVNRAREVELEMAGDVGSSRDVDEFHREWVRQVLRDTLALMERDCAERNRTDVWTVFRLRVVDPILQDAAPVSYEEIVRQFGIGTPRQAINLLTTAKDCFTRHLRTVVGRYVPEDGVETEIAALSQIAGR